MNAIPQLAPDEPLSPELVLVLPPPLRAQALAALGPPVWPTPGPRPRVAEPPAPTREPLGRALVGVLAARTVQFVVIFAAVTVVTLAMSLVAHAVR